MKSDLISIIIPIYNCQNYLKDNLNSVINQSYKNIEIILINDGSTDNSLKICNDYANRDKRIKIINQKNFGCASARNSGLDICKGKYVCFIDSDDVIHKDMIKLLYYCVVKDKSDISICRSLEFDENNKIDISSPISNVETKSYSNNEIINKLNTTNDISLAIWARLYNSKLFSKKRFPLIKTSEDNFLTYELFTSSKKISLIETYLYYNRNRIGSLTRNKSYIDLNLLYEGLKVIDYIKIHLEDQYYNTILKYTKLSIGLYDSMIVRKNINREYLDIIHKQVKDWYITIKNNVNISLIIRFQINLFIYSPKIYKLIYIIYKKIKRGDKDE